MKIPCYQFVLLVPSSNHILIYSVGFVDFSWLSSLADVAIYVTYQVATFHFTIAMCCTSAIFNS